MISFSFSLKRFYENSLESVPLFFLGLVFLLLPVAHISFGSFPVYLSEWAFLLFLLSIGVISGWGVFWHRMRDLFLSERTFFLLLGIFLLGEIMSYCWNNPTWSGLGKIKSFYIFPVLVTVVLVAWIQTKEEATWLVFNWFLGIVAAALASLIAARFGWFLYDGRLAGFYESPNYLAFLLAPGCLIGMFLLFSFQKRWERWGVLFVLGMIFFVLFLTRSYNAWVGVFLSSVSFSFLSFRGRKILFPLSLLLILLASLVFLQESGSEKFSALSHFKERSSLSSRLIIWKSAIILVRQSFPLGIGPSHFQSAYLTLQPNFPPYLEWAVPTPHNLLLHFLLEGGVLSAVAWIGVTVLLFRRYQKKQALIGNDPHPFFLATLGFSLVNLFFFLGLFDTPYAKNDLAITFWASFGLLLSGLRSRE